MDEKSTKDGEGFVARWSRRKTEVKEKLQDQSIGDLKEEETSALGEIEMAGYDSNDLSAMVEKVTSGTAGALGKIQIGKMDIENGGSSQMKEGNQQ